MTIKHEEIIERLLKTKDSNELKRLLRELGGAGITDAEVESGIANLSVFGAALESMTAALKEGGGFLCISMRQEGLKVTSMIGPNIELGMMKDLSDSFHEAIEKIADTLHERNKRERAKKAEIAEAKAEAAHAAKH